jgi:Tol biopolymer transport system component
MRVLHRTLLLAATLVAAALATSCEDDADDDGPSPWGAGVYDTEQFTFRSIALPNPISRASWVDDGESFLAFDTEGRRWVLYSVDGTTIRVVEQDSDDSHAEFYRGPDADHLFVDRDGDISVLDVRSGEEAPFRLRSGNSSAPMISPDGRRAAYTSAEGDTTVIVLADEEGGNIREIHSEDDPDGHSG